MSFWKQHEKLVRQQWELNRRRLEREVAERRRDLVRRNLRQSSEWHTYEPFTDWYLEREIEAFAAAVDEVSGGAHVEIDDESLDEMDRMLAEMIDRRRQLAPPNAPQVVSPDPARVKGLARVGLLKVQSQRRAERERGAAAPSRPPVRRSVRDRDPAVSPAPTPAQQAGEPPATAGAEPSEGWRGEDALRLTENLRRLGQLIQRLPDPEAQAESLEELQFVAEEATVEPDQRKLRMVAAALERIAARLSVTNAADGIQATTLARPVRRWFEAS